jgi:hypothetical protein
LTFARFEFVTSGRVKIAIKIFVVMKGRSK